MKQIFKTLVFIIPFIYTFSYATAQSKATFDAPDQVTWHASSKTWFVANLGGGVSFAKDNYGWISRLNADGEVINAHWISGFDAPSGMTTLNGKLYVCDRDGIVQVDVATAKRDTTYVIKGAEFINDVTISLNGDLYVSDFYGNKIYRIGAKDKKPELFLSIPDSPDGLYADGDKLIVATWGKIINKETFETSRKGNLLVIDLKTKEYTSFLKGVSAIGNLEGITKVDDAYYVTDWMVGKLLKISVANGIETILSGLKNPADPDYSPELGTIGIPEHVGSRVLFFKIK